MTDPERSEAEDQPEPVEGAIDLAQDPDGGLSEEPVTTPRFGVVASVLRDPRLAWAVALLALVSAMVLGLQARSLRALEDRRTGARDAAETVGARLTTFEGATIDQWVADVQQLSTSEYAGQLVERFDQDLRASLRANDVRSTGEILDTYIQRLQGEEAFAFILVRQTSTNAQRPEPIEDELRMEITLQDVDGEWLAADVAVLGPSFLAGGETGDVPPPSQAPSAGPVPAGPTAPSTTPAG